MCRHASSIGCALGDNNQCSHLESHPPTLASDACGQARLAIHDAYQLLDINDQRLDLDHQQRPSPRMPRQQIDPAALSVDRKGDLGCDLPAEPKQPPRDRVFKRRMSGVEKSVELTSPPAGNEVDANVEDGGGATEAVHGNAADMASLDDRYLRTGDSCPSGNVNLAPILPNSHRSKCGPNSLIAHPRRIATGTYRALIRDCASDERLPVLRWL